MNRRELLISIVLMVPVAWLVLWLRTWWFIEVLPAQSFGPSPEWVSPAHVTRWLFEFAWSFVLGIAVASLARSKSKVSIAAFCGAVEGLLHFSLSSNHFMSFAHWTLYFWAYGTFFVPAVGAAVGARIRVGIFPKNEPNAA